MKGSYNKDDVIQCLTQSGVSENDTLYSHVGLLKLGIPDEAYAGTNPFNVVYDAISEVISPSGTFITPTYTYSFCEGEVYDPHNTPSAIGPFGNKLLKHKDVVRSIEPIFSVAGVGPHMTSLTQNLPNNSFGPDCFYDRLGQTDAVICHIGVDLYFSTCIHYLEQLMGSPHRFMKIFTGDIHNQGVSQRLNWLYNVRVWGDFSHPRFDRLQDEVLRNGACKKVRLGEGYLYTVKAKDLYATAHDMLTKNLLCFAEDPLYNPKLKVAKLPLPRAASESLSKNATTDSIMRKIADVPIDAVSEGYDHALSLLSTQVPIKILEYFSGEECQTWIIPEKWTCHSGSVKKMNGTPVLTFSDNPLHVMSYSLPIDRKVSKEELHAHLHTNDEIPWDIPAKSKYYERDWGFCCSKKTKETLTDQFYQVEINASFSYGSLKIGEVTAKGKSEQSYIICTTLNSPTQINNGVSGVCAGIQIMQDLLSRDNLQYTYRLLIMPDTFGPAAWLSTNEDHTNNILGGICLDQLTQNGPHALQCASTNKSQLDKISEQILKQMDSKSHVGDYSTIENNIASAFNSPGIDIPMVTLVRSEPENATEENYRDCSAFEERINQSAVLTLSIIEALEANTIPQRNFAGDLFTLRYPKVNQALLYDAGLKDVLHSIDGKRTIADIADILGRSFSPIKQFIDTLIEEKLVST